jgi:PAS domain S-box-containing protein
MIENLSQDVFESILNTLPVEISFVDENDVVRYFNKNGDRIFPRPRSVIGLRVHDCHPKKSVHIVDRLLGEMKNNKRDVAEFWIDLKGKTIYIRYFAVRDSDDKYLGCLEVTQDITEIKNIEGERRLLDTV